MSELPKTQQYVRYFTHDIFVSNETTRALKTPVDTSLPPAQLYALLDIPAHAYAFSLFEKARVVVDGETLLGERKNESPVYYPDGVRMNYKIASSEGRSSMLASNMQMNGWDFVVRTRHNGFQVYTEGKTVVFDTKG